MTRRPATRLPRLTRAIPPALTVGSRVYWTDPDAGIASGPGTVTALQHDPVEADSVISLVMDDGGEAEVLRHEVRLLARP